MKQNILLFILLLFLVQLKLVISDCGVPLSPEGICCQGYNFYCWPSGLGCCSGGFPYYSLNPLCISCDNTPPTHSYDGDTSGGSVTTGTMVKAYVLWSDEFELNYSVFRLRIGTGNWENVSLNSCSLSGTSQWCNTTITTTSGDIGKTICWNQWANDIMDNWNNTMPNHCFNVVSPIKVISVTDSISFHFTITSSIKTKSTESFFESIIRSITASSSDIVIKFVTLAFEFFGIVILFILLVLLIQSLIESK